MKARGFSGFARNVLPGRRQTPKAVSLDFLATLNPSSDDLSISKANDTLLLSSKHKDSKEGGEIYPFPKFDHHIQSSDMRIEEELSAESSSSADGKNDISRNDFDDSNYDSVLDHSLILKKMKPIDQNVTQSDFFGEGNTKKSCRTP